MFSQFILNCLSVYFGSILMMSITQSGRSVACRLSCQLCLCATYWVVRITKRQQSNLLNDLKPVRQSDITDPKHAEQSIRWIIGPWGATAPAAAEERSKKQGNKGKKGKHVFYYSTLLCGVDWLGGGWWRSMVVVVLRDDGNVVDNGLYAEVVYPNAFLV